jgi:transcriptional regulator with XRE-family HTH domain
MSGLKAARFLRGFSQAELGKESGLDAAIISRLENDLYGDTPAVLKWKEKIASALGLPVRSLFPEIEPKQEGKS